MHRRFQTFLYPLFSLRFLTVLLPAWITCSWVFVGSAWIAEARPGVPSVHLRQLTQENTQLLNVQADELEQVLETQKDFPQMRGPPKQQET